MEIRTITITKFHDKYFPGMQKQVIAKKMNITPCAYSKIKKGILPKTSIFWKAASEFVASFGYHLIMDDKYEVIETEYEKKIRNLTLKIKQQEQEIVKLKNQIEWYEAMNQDLKQIYKKLKEKFEC